jgi:RNA 3'-terminal phosphate cyclase (ATP)
MTADAPSQLLITGGTCNPKAPPVEFLVRAFLPLLRRMGAQVELTLNAHGFYPAGGGEIAVTIEPRPLSPIELVEIGERRVTAKILLAKLPRKIAERELEVLSQQLDLAGSEIVETDRAGSPGNAVFVAVEGATTEVFTGFGERGVPGWKVAGAAADETLRFLADEVPVGEHLADQLLIPLALAKGGRFLTVAPSLHTTTNIEIVERFLPARIRVTRKQEKAEISVS